MDRPARIRGPRVLIGLFALVFTVTAGIVLWAKLTPPVDRPRERMQGAALKGAEGSHPSLGHGGSEGEAGAVNVP